MGLIEIEWFYAPYSEEKVTVNLTEALGEIKLLHVPYLTFNVFLPYMNLSFADATQLAEELSDLENYICAGDDDDDDCIPGRIEWLNHRWSSVVGDLRNLIYDSNLAGLYVHKLEYRTPPTGMVGMVTDSYRRCESVFKDRMGRWEGYRRIRPKKLWFNPPYTTVEFCDGEKVTVRAEDGTACSRFGGFAACMLKKYCGGATEAIKLMEECEQAAKEASPSYIRKQMLEKRKIERRKRHELKVAKREAAIKAKEDELRILREAEKRLEQERLEKGE